MSSEVMVIDYQNQQTLKTIQETVAIGATPSEFSMFVELCKASGLNPFRKEVWFIKVQGRAQIMTGINGFFAIANAHPMFDGYESGLVAPDGSLVPASYPKEDYIGAWSKVYRKDRRIPTEAVVFLKEYDKQQSNWKTMKRVMITKVADSVALRKSFPQELNGLYTAEEMPVSYSLHQAELKADPLERAFQAKLDAAPPVMQTERELEQYVINYSPDSGLNGMMLCEIEEDVFLELAKNKANAKLFDDRDLVNLRQYYSKHIRKNHNTKKDIAEKIKDKMNEGGTHPAIKD